MNYDGFGPMARVALGKADADLVLKNARVVNVFTDEIVPCDVAIQGGMIVGLGCYEGREQVDLQGRYVCPGFIDAHLHFESAMVTPAKLVNAAMQWGTTTFIADPHEAVNVAGEDGLDYILDQIEGVDANVLVMLPSCVPVTDEEENGCDFSAERMERYLHHPKVLGLGEVMDYVAVTEAAPSMMQKLALFHGRPKDGHAPLLSDKQLAAYALAKIRTDHECVDYAYALKQARNGMQVLIREGSGARNLEAIVRGIVADRMNTSRFSFCTDDKHIEDIEREGHISFNIRRSVQLGIDPIQAIKMATINTANCYHLDELGAVAPGYRADLVILDDLADVAIHAVYCAGQRHDPSRVAQTRPCKPSLRNSVHIAPIDARQMDFPVEAGDSPMIEMISGQISTRMRRGSLPARNGLFTPNDVHNKVVVVERHRATGHIGVAPVIGFHLRNGAIATSVSHDSHNIIAIGDNDEHILLAIRELERAQGGYTIVRGESAPETLALPIMGLMSDAEHGAMARTLNRMIRIAHEMGVPADMDPFVSLSFLALTVIPEVRVTTKGMYDVIEHSWMRGARIGC